MCARCALAHRWGHSRRKRACMRSAARHCTPTSLKLSHPWPQSSCRSSISIKSVHPAVGRHDTRPSTAGRGGGQVGTGAGIRHRGRRDGLGSWRARGRSRDRDPGHGWRRARAGGDLPPCRVHSQLEVSAYRSRRLPALKPRMLAYCDIVPPVPRTGSATPTERLSKVACYGVHAHRAQDIAALRRLFAAWSALAQARI